MKKRMVGWTLLAAFLLLAGCAAQPGGSKETLDPLLAQELNVSAEMAENLASGIQTVDQWAEGEQAKLHVRQTFGNCQELYVLYDVTFAEGIDPAGENVYMEGARFTDEKWLRTESHQSIQREGQTVTYLTYLARSYDAWEDRPYTFEVGPLRQGGSGTDPASWAVLAEAVQVSWTPKNTGEVWKGTILSQEGEDLGLVTLSPFGMYYLLSSSRQPSYNALEATVKLTNQEGEDIHIYSFGGSYSKGTQGGEEVLLSVRGDYLFPKVMDLSQVKGLSIDGHTVVFEQ